MTSDLLTHLVKLLVLFFTSGRICNTCASENARPKLRFQSETKTIVELKDILMPVLRDNSVFIKEVDLESCNCKGYSCGCCLTMTVKWLYVDDTACVNITYLPAVIGFQLTLSVDGHIFIDKKISAKNPPELCAGIPLVSKLASVCLKLYDLSLKNHQVHVCIKLQLYAVFSVLAEYNIGCFYIPPGSKKLVMINENQFALMAKVNQLALEENVLIV